MQDGPESPQSPAGVGVSRGTSAGVPGNGHTLCDSLQRQQQLGRAGAAGGAQRMSSGQR